MVDDDIRAMRAIFEVDTDRELAAAMGITRSTISKWRRRGAVPSYHRVTLELAEQDVTGRLLDASLTPIFARPEGHYLLRAALAFMPQTLPTPPGADLAERGTARVVVLAALINAARTACDAYLGKRYPEGAEDYARLVEAMRAEDGDTLEALAVLAAEEGPQSGSSIDPEDMQSLVTRENGD